MIGKPALFRLHKWVGITAAAFLFVQALTGLTLVFGPELASVIDPRGMLSGPGSGSAAPSDLVTAAEAQYPEYRLSRLVFPATDDGTYLAHLTNERGALRYVSLDRHDASVLRAGSVWHFPIVAALDIHYHWMTGRLGMALVTLSGLALATLAVTGLAFWWPRRSWRKSLAVRTDAKPRIVLRQAHRTTGVVMFPLLLFMSVTGLALVVPMLIEPSTKPWSRTGSLAQPVERALDIARRVHPGHEVRDVRISSPARINVFFRAPERNSRAVHRVSVGLPGERIESVLHASADNALWVIVYPLHTGEALGLVGRLIVLITGLLLACISAAGAVMWIQARQAKAQSARGRARKRTSARPEARA